MASCEPAVLVSIPWCDSVHVHVVGCLRVGVALWNAHEGFMRV